VSPRRVTCFLIHVASIENKGTIEAPPPSQ
jgi:hypothetical protein